MKDDALGTTYCANAGGLKYPLLTCPYLLRLVGVKVNKVRGMGL